MNEQCLEHSPVHLWPKMMDLVLTARESTLVDCEILESQSEPVVVDLNSVLVGCIHSLLFK